MADEALYPIIGSELSLPFYVHGTGWCEYQYHVIRPEGYPVAQINYCTAGTGELIVNDRHYSIHKGMSFFLPINLKHEYYTTGHHWSIHWVTFAGSNMQNLLKNLHLTDALILTHPITSKIDTLWSQVFHAIKKDTQYGNYRASAFLYEYLLEYHYDLIHSLEKKSPADEKLKSVIDFINQHYIEDLRIIDLATVNGTSSQALCKQFQRYYHMRPFEYITKKRLQVAKTLLMTGKYSVGEVAKHIGYHDCSYFCKLFRQYEHMSPSTLIPTLTQK